MKFSYGKKGAWNWTFASGQNGIIEIGFTYLKF